ncbi:uncharacterized protein F4822DRAFT_155333, partial [Hypoxylon trugodes]|uniref:uncharacterized protein n=1 Tax=Hypoxylon trugodes TaxID=326681 RepID=UPI0021952B39
LELRGIDTRAVELEEIPFKAANISYAHGLVCDSLVNYEIVLANGEIANANAKLNEDLWIALATWVSSLVSTLLSLNKAPCGTARSSTSNPVSPRKYKASSTICSTPMPM